MIQFSQAGVEGRDTEIAYQKEWPQDHYQNEHLLLQLLLFLFFNIFSVHF